MIKVTLPTYEGGLELFALDEGVAPCFPVGWNRTVYAAAHVIVDPLQSHDPWAGGAVDWDRTLAFRTHLWEQGFGIAEAMDTAQRGMGMDWSTSLELIKRSVNLAKQTGALIACGAGTDHLELDGDLSLDLVMAAYEKQCQAVEAAGGRIILMASRALAKIAKSPDDYVRVYHHILSQLAEPAIIHWLGEMFDPQLVAYWGHADHDGAMETCLDILKENASKIDGIKISLLSPEKEIAMRRRLPTNIKMYTGDDFNYPDLIAGDEEGFSHALLGIFDPIAPVAARAFNALSVGDKSLYHDLFAPTLPLSRHIFQAPTRFYKTGVVFLSYLNGHQDHFTMLGGQQSARSLLHLADIIRLASRAGLFTDREEVARRVKRVMNFYGVGV